MKSMQLLLISLVLTGLMAGCCKKEPTPPAAPEPAAKAPAEPAEAPPAKADQPVEGGKLGQKAAPLEGMTYLKGDPVTFEAGKVYVIEFWATWCGPCKASIPHLTELQKKLKDKGVTIIGISREKLEVAKPFVEQMGEKMGYTIAVDTERKVDRGYMEAFRQAGIPHAFIVDGQGNLAWRGHPLSSADGMDQALEQIIDGTFDSAAYAKAKAERDAERRELGKLIKKYLTDLRRGATIEETRPTAERILELDITSGWYALARHIVLTPNVDDANRDMEMAVKAAKKACDESNYKDVYILTSYAMVLSKADQLEEAIAMQQKAVELAAGNEEVQADLKKQLDEYRKLLEEKTTNPSGEEAPIENATPPLQQQMNAA